MITTARQLKDLIRNLSKKKSADAQILMRNYMMEIWNEYIIIGLISERKRGYCNGYIRAYERKTQRKAV